MLPQTTMSSTRIKKSKGKLVKQSSMSSSREQTQCIINAANQGHQEKICNNPSNIKTATLLINKVVVQVKVLVAKAHQSRMFNKVNHRIYLEHIQWIKSFHSHIQEDHGRTPKQVLKMSKLRPTTATPNQSWVKVNTQTSKLHPDKSWTRYRANPLWQTMFSQLIFITINGLDSRTS